MELRMEKRGSVAIVSIDGSVDGTSAPDLVSSLHQQVTAGMVHLVADFAGTDYTSSAGLRALLEMVKETRQHGGDLRLASVRREVLRVLELSGFTSILQVYPDVESAVASFPA